MSGVRPPERSQTGLDLLPTTLLYSPAISALPRSIRSKWTGRRIVHFPNSHPVFPVGLDSVTCREPGSAREGGLGVSTSIHERILTHIKFDAL